MREDQLEQLEKIMPNGFIVVMGMPDEQRHVKLVMSNRDENPYLYLIVALIRQFIKDLTKKCGGEDAISKEG